MVLYLFGMLKLGTYIALQTLVAKIHFFYPGQHSHRRDRRRKSVSAHLINVMMTYAVQMLM